MGFFSGVALCLEVIETTCPSHVSSTTMIQLGPPRTEYTSDQEYNVFCQGITSIPDDIPTEAVRVSIRGNTINTVKANDFNELDRCTYLSLTYNEITSIEPGAFTGLDALWSLSLSYNKLTQIESGLFSGLVKLKWLLIRDNELTRIESRIFSGITSLEILDLSDNDINYIELGSFSGLVSLTNLEIKINQLTYIGSGLFSGLVALQTIDLNRNELGYIESGVFSGLPSLKSIYLCSNKISHIEPGSFYMLPALQWLDLHGNELINFSWTIFASQGNINFPTQYQDRDLYLFINHNPFHCNTSMCWVKHNEQEWNNIGEKEGWIRNRGYDGISVKCANYPRTSWSDVQLNCSSQGKRLYKGI